MKKSVLYIGLYAMLFAFCDPASSQQPGTIYRIGFLGTASAPNYTTRLKAFRESLHRIGYIEGKNITIESRFANGRPDRTAELAAELVRLNMNLIVTHGSAIYPAKNATSTIPIVMAASGDAVGTGVVASLARPGGNITGLTTISTELYGKRLELLKEVLPKLSQIAVITDAGPGSVIAMDAIQTAANALRVQFQRLEVRSSKDFDGAVNSAIKSGAGALIVVQGAITSSYRKHHIDLAIKNRLPGIYNEREFAEDGGLISYGAKYVDMYRRAGVYVDKILKGAKPADLPVEQPTTFELIINLKTAKQIGLTIPPNVLARADRVIK